MTNNLFNPGDQIIFTPENKAYKFAHYINKTSCAIYQEIDIKKQDLFEVQIKHIKKYE